MNVTRIIRAGIPPVTLVRQGGQTVRLIRSAGAPVQLVSSSRTSIVVQSGPTTYPAAVPLSGGRLVRLTDSGLAYYDAADASQAYSLLGVSLNAGNVGDLVSVQVSGIVTHVGWGLLPEQRYAAGPNGFLAVNPAASAFSQLVGRALDANRLNFSPSAIIFSA